MRKVLHFSPVLKVRVFGTRKWFIISFVKDNMERWNQGGIWENEEQKQRTYAKPSSTASTGRGTHKKKERGIKVTIVPFTTRKIICKANTDRWNTEKFKHIECLTRGGDSHMKQTGMLVVSLRGVNFGFWSRLGCSGQSANILSRQGLV